MLIPNIQNSIVVPAVLFPPPPPPPPWARQQRLRRGLQAPHGMAGLLWAVWVWKGWKEFQYLLLCHIIHILNPSLSFPILGFFLYPRPTPCGKETASHWPGPPFSSAPSAVQTAAFMCILNVLQLDLIFHTHNSNSPESHWITIFWYSDIWASKLVPLTHHGPDATSISRLRFTSVLWLCSKRRAMSFTVFGTWQAIGPIGPIGPLGHLTILVTLLGTASTPCNVLQQSHGSHGFCLNSSDFQYNN